MKNIKDTYIKVNITSTLKKKAEEVAKIKGLTLPDFVRYQLTKGIDEEERESYLGMLAREARAAYAAGKLKVLESAEDIEKEFKQMAEEVRAED